MQRNKKTFKGQNIYIGIDVHNKPKEPSLWFAFGLRIGQKR